MSKDEKKVNWKIKQEKLFLKCLLIKDKRGEENVVLEEGEELGMLGLPTDPPTKPFSYLLMFWSNVSIDVKVIVASKYIGVTAWHWCQSVWSMVDHMYKRKSLITGTWILVID